jgi:glycosyltransferase involved in cell wall biosynthesis
VAGRSPAASLVAELEQDGIRVVASPESLDPLYADAMFSVIPATSGSGAKIKVCEALSRGVPVLTTPTGLVGQPEAIKRCCVVREHAEEWIGAIEAQARNAFRSPREWDVAVSDALSASYFGNSIQQIAALIRS